MNNELAEKKIGRYRGVVRTWDGRKGFGHMVMLNKNQIVGSSRIFVHKSNINDDYQGLFVDEIVEFDLYLLTENGRKIFKALDVCKIRWGMHSNTAVRRGVSFSV
jgi:cold shock CspA family protein